MDDSIKFKYKIEIIDIFPTIEEITQNNTDKMTLEIPILKEEIILNDLTSKNKNIIYFNEEIKSLNFILSKNNNPFAGTNVTLTKGSQWITFKYENTNNVSNNNKNKKNSLALSLIDCIKIKILFSDFNNDNHNNSINNNINNNYKKHTQLFSEIHLKKNSNNINNNVINNATSFKKNNNYLKLKKLTSISTSKKKNQHNNSYDENVNFSLLFNDNISNVPNSSQHLKKKQKKLNEKNIFNHSLIITKNEDLFGIETSINNNNNNYINNTTSNNKRVKTPSKKNSKKNNNSTLNNVTFNNNNITNNNNKNYNSIIKNLDNNFKNINIKKPINTPDEKKSPINENILSTTSTYQSSDIEKKKINNINNSNNNKIQTFDFCENFFEKNFNENLFFDEEKNQFSMLKEDFFLLYTDEYTQNISNDLITFELELLIEKIFELIIAYHIQIKNLKEDHNKLNVLYKETFLQFYLLNKKLFKLQNLKEKNQIQKSNIKIVKNNFYKQKINVLDNQFNEFQIIKNILGKKINENKKFFLKEIILKLINNNPNLISHNKNFMNWFNKAKKNVNNNNSNNNNKKKVKIEIPTINIPNNINNNNHNYSSKSTTNRGVQKNLSFKNKYNNNKTDKNLKKKKINK